MSKKVDTWMPLLVDKYLGDTMLLTTEQHGAYLLLLMTMWKKDGRLPDNDVQLAQASKLSASKWKGMRPVLIDGSLLREEDGFIVQKRLSAELARSKSHTDAKAEAGARGAAKRWGKGAQEHGNRDGRSDGTAIAEPSQSHRQTGASTPPPFASQIPESTSVLSARGAVGKALKAGGLDPRHINLSDPRLAALIEQGATPDEFEGLAREAVSKGIAKPIGWICSALTGRREQAAGMRLAPSKAEAAATAAASASDAWRRSDKDLRAMALQLAVPSYPDDTIDVFERRVVKAWRTAGEPALQPSEAQAA